MIDVSTCNHKSIIWGVATTHLGAMWNQLVLSIGCRFLHLNSWTCSLPSFHGLRAELPCHFKLSYSTADKTNLKAVIAETAFIQLLWSCHHALQLSQLSVIRQSRALITCDTPASATRAWTWVCIGTSPWTRLRICLFHAHWQPSPAVISPSHSCDPATLTLFQWLLLTLEFASKHP